MSASGIYATFDSVAQARPQSIAIAQGGRTPWTYADLRRSAASAAARLRASGIRPGDRVAILAPRGMETIAAFLAILKTGAIFVPLDLGYPDEQILFMLEDSKPALTIVSAAAKARIEANAGSGRVLSLESITSDPAPIEEDAATIDGDAPASLMYTSGSTGRPKGAIIPHRAILRLVRGQDFCDLSSQQVILHLSPLAFDASTLEIWGALLNGGTIAIVESERPSIAQIGEAIQQHGVTTAWLTAGLFHLMVDHAIDALRPLKQLLAGGDVLSMAHVRKAQASLPDCRIINGYGPTENTTFTCCYTFPRSGEVLAAAPIGSPIFGGEVFILDESLVPVADGEEGQLAACGAGLALGYFNQPELSAQKFVMLPAPVSKQAYLTGDRARRNADGTIDFFGRNDGQVKISGKRVELGEIDHILRQDPEIEDAAVIVVESGADLKTIVAFIAPKQSLDEAQLAAELRGRLKSKLPDHMIPGKFILVEALPLTPNGKVDRAALKTRAKDNSAPPRAIASAVPRTSIESDILRLWTSVLDAPNIGLQQNFFDLGGRSLQLMRLHVEIQQTLGREFPLSAMFDHPTIRDLAAYLSGAVEAPAAENTARDRAARGRAAAERMRSKAGGARR